MDSYLEKKFSKTEMFLPALHTAACWRFASGRTLQTAKTRRTTNRIASAPLDKPAGQIYFAYKGKAERKTTVTREYKYAIQS